MEDGLVQAINDGTHTYSSVLILIVVEDGLVQQVQLNAQDFTMS